jgi:SOS response regulatory protein OraA/RecX
MKVEAVQKQRAAAQAQAEAKSHSQVQTPSTQDKKRDHSKVDRNLAPPKLPKDGFSLEDVRRVVISI